MISRLAGGGRGEGGGGWGKDIPDNTVLTQFAGCCGQRRVLRRARAASGGPF